MLDTSPFPKMFSNVLFTRIVIEVRLIKWCFTPLSTLFQSYHGDSSQYLCLSWVSPVLGWALKCPATGHSCEKKPRGSSAARTQDPWITSQTLKR